MRVCFCVCLLEKCNVNGVAICIAESWLSKQAVFCKKTETFTFTETLLIILFEPPRPSPLLMKKKSVSDQKCFLQTKPKSLISKASKSYHLMY